MAANEGGCLITQSMIVAMRVNVRFTLSWHCYAQFSRLGTSTGYGWSVSLRLQLSLVRVDQPPMTTNMLTWPEIEAQRASGRLVRWLPSPRMQIEAGWRCLYMLKSVHDAFDARPWPSTQPLSPTIEKQRRQTMRAVLGRYVTGKGLNYGADMKELGSRTADAKFTGFWEFRSQPPQEETRLFGFFARPGAFVATSFKGRGSFGGINHPSWFAERQHGEQEWRDLFGAKAYMTSPWPVRIKMELKAYLDREDD